MQIALKEARAASARGEVPVGAVIVDSRDKTILARTGNRVVETTDPTAHGEILAIREAASSIGNHRLEGCDLFVTLEPCPMCAQAISLARIRRLYFGAYDRKSGGIEQGPCIFAHSTCHHKPEIVGGFMEMEASNLLLDFFKTRRKMQNPSALPHPQSFS
ncbi:MAG: tRNA-specific adenosine deaminase [Rhodospirillaceae bacterium TMED8]|nr:tRNA-specific adenosine deaminase [Magnetovibrio sp.]OUT47759.1 MAG: tRNA-specific adenosine deaminase [Rhodospirillaceae bacterium TMED8]